MLSNEQLEYIKPWGLTGLALNAVVNCEMLKLSVSKENGNTIRLYTSSKNMKLMTNNIYNRILAVLRNYYGHVVIVHIHTAKDDISKPSYRERIIKNGKYHLTEEEVRNIKILLKENRSAESISVEFSVTLNAIKSIQSGRTWASITI